MRAQAILFSAPGAVGLGEVDVPEPGPGEVLVRAAFTCLSPGTELRCLAGKQAGTPGWPLVPGYALAGHVERGGPGATLPPGTAVLCGGTARCSAHRLWGGHVAWAVQPEAAVRPIPPGVDLVSAAAARLAAIAYHGCRMSRPEPHETVAVVGLGAIGQLAARAHLLSGARVLAADRSAGRVALARAAGVEAFVPGEDLAAAFREQAPGGVEVVVEATGAPEVAAQAVLLAREQPPGDGPVGGARLLIQGTYAGGFVLDYMPAFRRELTVLLPRDRQPRDETAVLDLIRRQRLQVRDLVSVVRRPEDAPEVYAALRDAPGDLITAAFAWGDAQ